MTQREKEKIDAVTSLQEYFYELVRKAIGRQKVVATKEAEFYLVNLLRDFLKTEKVYENRSDTFKEEPLALMLQRAFDADQTSKVTILKKMGDFSLYIAGFFPNSLSRQLVDIDYYIKMGGSAYQTLSQAPKSPRALRDIFLELAEKFLFFVDVLSEVSEESTLKSHLDILRLYETWLKTGSERAFERLHQEGIIPYRAGGYKISQ
ncbi:MAG: hypothetical protein HYS22_04465 [Deltaproteobacteria bacterium]|nr:hypothetical protein [Deltaproteobacteria bacterium]